MHRTLILGLTAIATLGASIAPACAETYTLSNPWHSNGYALASRAPLSYGIDDRRSPALAAGLSGTTAVLELGCFAMEKFQDAHASDQVLPNGDEVVTGIPAPVLYASEVGSVVGIATPGLGQFYNHNWILGTLVTLGAPLAAIGGSVLFQGLFPARNPDVVLSDLSGVISGAQLGLALYSGAAATQAYVEAASKNDRDRRDLTHTGARF